LGQTATEKTLYTKSKGSDRGLRSSPFFIGVPREFWEWAGSGETELIIGGKKAGRIIANRHRKENHVTIAVRGLARMDGSTPRRKGMKRRLGGKTRRGKIKKGLL